MSSLWKCAMLLPISMLIAGCAADTPAMPGIVSTTKHNGKGLPYGRSDSALPFGQITAISTDPTFGRRPENAIKVGGSSYREGDRQERLYLNALRGPSGEPIEYERVGACCIFQTPNGIEGGGLLDVFKVQIDGRGADDSLLYIDMYDPAPFVAPMGFTARTTPIVQSSDTVRMRYAAR